MASSSPCVEWIKPTGSVLNLQKRLFNYINPLDLRLIKRKIEKSATE